MEILVFIKDVFAGTPTAAAILFSAFIAYLALKKNERIARQKNTLDFEANYLTKDMLEAYEILSKIYNNKFNVPMVSWAEDENFNSDESKAVRTILNAWERIARGIEHDIYDEDIMFDTYSTTVKKLDWYTFDFRKATQKVSPTYYTCFDRLASNWFVKRQGISCTPKQARRIRALTKMLRKHTSVSSG